MTSTGLASPAPKRVEIPRFPAGKRGAVTFSFDDGTIFDRPLIELFNDLGLKGTFNLNSGSLGRERHVAASEVAALYEGHEVAIHTVTHPFLERLDASQIATEVLDDRKALEDLVGYPVRGMAYPFGTYNEKVIEVLSTLGVAYSRTTENAADSYPNARPLAWASNEHKYVRDPDGTLATPGRFEKAYASGQPFTRFVWGHSYEFEGKWEDATAIFTPLAGKSDVWYCTNIELHDYAWARQQIVIAANRRTAWNPTAIPVTLKVEDGEIVVGAGAVAVLE